jgi:hypothetical protein
MKEIRESLILDNQTFYIVVGVFILAVLLLWYTKYITFEKGKTKSKREKNNCSNEKNKLIPIRVRIPTNKNCYNCGGNLATSENGIVKCVFCGTVHEKQALNEVVKPVLKDSEISGLSKISMVSIIAFAGIIGGIYLMKKIKNR